MSNSFNESAYNDQKSLMKRGFDDGRASRDVEVALKDAQIAELESYRAKYNELLFAVARKFEGETRHETALRYIQNEETVIREASAKWDHYER